MLFAFGILVVPSSRISTSAIVAQSILGTMYLCFPHDFSASRRFQWR